MSLTPTIIDELTQDAVADIWNDALDWYIRQECDLNKYSDSCYNRLDTNLLGELYGYRLLPFRPRLAYQMTEWKYVVITTMDTLLFISTISLTMRFVFNARWGDALFGGLVLGFIFIVAFIIAQIFTPKLSALKPIANWTLRNHRRKIKAHNFSTEEKLNICGDFLIYKANIALFDANETHDSLRKQLDKHEAEAMSTNISLKNLNAQKGVVAELQKEAYTKQAAKRLQLCESIELQDHIMGRAKRQIQLAKSLHALASLCAERMTADNQQGLDYETELLDDEALNSTRQHIEKMSNVLTGAAEEATTLPKGPIMNLEAW